jgi:hypothetical protein
MSDATNDRAPASPARRRRRGGTARVDKWIEDARRIMEDYPELFVAAVDRVEAEAEEFFVHGRAATPAGPPPTTTTEGTQ